MLLGIIYYCLSMLEMSDSQIEKNKHTCSLYLLNFYELIGLYCRNHANL